VKKLHLIWSCGAEWLELDVRYHIRKLEGDGNRDGRDTMIVAGANTKAELATLVSPSGQYLYDPVRSTLCGIMVEFDATGDLAGRVYLIVFEASDFKRPLHAEVVNA
jgi:hypothetical protein